MSDNRNYKLMYRAVKSLLKSNARTERNPHARNTYLFVMGWMDNLEKMGGDIEDIEIEKVMVDGEVIQ